MLGTGDSPLPATCHSRPSCSGRLRQLFLHSGDILETFWGEGALRDEDLLCDIPWKPTITQEREIIFLILQMGKPRL